MRNLGITLLMLVAVVMSAVAKDKVVWGEYSTLERVNKPVPYYVNKPSGTLSGRDFMQSIDTVEFWKREDMIVKEILAGNMPKELKTFQKVQIVIQH